MRRCTVCRRGNMWTCQNLFFVSRPTPLSVAEIGPLSRQSTWILGCIRWKICLLLQALEAQPYQSYLLRLLSLDGRPLPPGKDVSSSEARRNKHWKYISSYHVCAQRLSPVCLTGAELFLLPGPLATTSSRTVQYAADNEFELRRPGYASDFPSLSIKKAARPHCAGLWRFYTSRVPPYHIFSSTASSSFIVIV